MKKFIFTALVAAFATTSFAQDIVKQMKGQSYSEATATLNGALSGLSAEQKAKGYNQLVEIVFPDASKAFETITLANMQKTKVEVDTYTPIVNALNEAVKCDEFDNQPNDKGKVAPKFRKKNADRLATFRNVLINAANETTDPDKKLFLANAYINSSESPLFAEALKAGDPYLGYAQFFAAAAYYNKENWTDRMFFTIVEGGEGIVFNTGDTGTLSIVLEEKNNVLTLPTEAVHNAYDKWYVYVINETGDREVKWIETGLRGSGIVEITSGLEEGEKVILK